MNKSGVKIDDILYWNTSGAYNTNISLKCTVMDIGIKYIWVMVHGNLCPTPLPEDALTKLPKYAVTNARFDSDGHLEV